MEKIEKRREKIAKKHEIKIAEPTKPRVVKENFKSQPR